ncbi:MAG: hypothetical protein AAGF44_05360 [Pseudomonadota bacterium]
MAHPKDQKHDPQAPPEHWLVRPETVRRIWIGSLAVLAFLVLLDFFIIEDHPYFAAQTWFAFNAWYGFGICALLVFFSKGLGFLLKVRDDFYDD